jgi:Flp pilus assembly protein CpaB
MSIILASTLLSFLLVSCGNDEATANGANKVNIAAGQAANTPLPAAPTATPTNTRLVIVAARPIAAGQVITLADIDTVQKLASEVVPDQDISSPGDAINRISKVSYNVGQQIKRGDLVEGTFSSYMRQLVADKRLEPGKKAFAYATNDLSTVTGLIQENDLVDVVATYVVERRLTGFAPGQVQAPTRDNPGFELTTKTVLQNVRVLKVVHLQPQAPAQPVQQATPTAVPNPDTPTAVVVAAATATPTPTLQPFLESGVGFNVNTVLVLGVTDQEAEVLKFTREYRVVGTAARLNTSNPVIGNGDTDYFSTAANIGTAIVHFVLRAKPQDPANPVDPAITRETTTGVTFRILVRDYALPIPELVFATNAQ